MAANSFILVPAPPTGEFKATVVLLGQTILIESYESIGFWLRLAGQAGRIMMMPYASGYKAGLSGSNFGLAEGQVFLLLRLMQLSSSNRLNVEIEVWKTDTLGQPTSFQRMTRPLSVMQGQPFQFE